LPKPAWQDISLSYQLSFIYKEGFTKGSDPFRMAKNLLIVESPAKAKTIEKYLGGDFEVKASYGHIRDLPKSNNAVRIDDGYKPVYVVSDDKLHIVNELKRLAKKAQQVWLATDEDREGEAISWHLLEELGLDIETTHRIVFHEITKTAIQKAIQQPRKINLNLVEAQQARRVLDRLVGFDLSPVLWRKVKPGLSAGRVQSVAVRLIVEREREVQQHVYESNFHARAQLLNHQLQPFKAEPKIRFADRQAAEKYLQQANGATLTVHTVEKKPAKRKPQAPFTTSTLQQEAAQRLGFSVSRTMRLAQQLYEAGHITYMRTDSVNLSEEALAAAKQVIIDSFGSRYHERRTFKSKVANAQEAHEAIRPTDFAARFIAELDKDQQHLYELVWRRATASQMADAELERTVAEIEVRPQGGGEAPALYARGEVILFDGFLKLYLDSRSVDDESEDSGLLPELLVGEHPTLMLLTATEEYNKPAPRYNEASLVRKLEELGIGRPSTYAPTISTIQDREYVVKEDREGKKRQVLQLTLKDGQITAEQLQQVYGAERNKLFPTDLGMLVTDFLVKYFPDVIDYSFTARVEEEFDEISRGKLRWNEMLDRFYPPFHEKVAQTQETAERVSGDRELGIDPRSGKPVIARLGRFGPLVQIGASDDPDKKFASLRPNQRIDTIALEDALKLFDLPRVVGTFEGEEIVANVGRFGPYLLHKKKFTSIPKGEDPMTITPERAIQVIEAKRIADEERILVRIPGTEWVILRGRWNKPFLSAEGQNVPLPKDFEIESASEETCRPLLEQFLASSATKKKGKGKKVSAATKAVAGSTAKSGNGSASKTKATSTSEKAEPKQVSTPKATTELKSGTDALAVKPKPKHARAASADPESEGVVVRRKPKSTQTVALKPARKRPSSQPAEPS
jgi:DNA topoisomerase-1